MRETVNFTWLQFGATAVDLGWVLDPLSAVMLVMVSFVGLLIFIYSVGYMAHDENYTRFFCFMSLFAGAMLGVVISNSLLLLFMCWEIVGLTSYLLIGFWYHKPSAAAAAKKAFITTRVGDIFFLLGIVWLFSQTGTLLFYNHGAGSLEPLALARSARAARCSRPQRRRRHRPADLCGSGGQERPVSAARVAARCDGRPHACLRADSRGHHGRRRRLSRRARLSADAGRALAGGTTARLTVVTWVGAATAVFAALIAVAQNDIKRILAYSTVSQLGYMMAGLGMGGVAVGMFHLITHAFFKALLVPGRGLGDSRLPRGAGHPPHGRPQADMPLTFATYAIGMLALCGFPLFFSGFWSKDGILEAAQHWSAGEGPVLSARLRRAAHRLLHDAPGRATSSLATGAATRWRTKARR